MVAQLPESTKNAAEKQWVDSIFQQLTVKQKIAQLIMIRAHSDKGADHIAQVEELIKNMKSVDFVFFKVPQRNKFHWLTNIKVSRKYPYWLVLMVSGAWA